MKKSIISACLIMLYLAASAAIPQKDGFIIKGKINGLKDGTVVRLMSLEKDDYKGTEMVSSTVINGAFTLKGKVKSPTLSRVEIVLTEEIGGQQYPKPKTIPTMIENTLFEIEAANIDSIPFLYEFKKTPLTKEMNVKVKGGKAQAEYNEYRAKMHPLELDAWKLNYKYREWFYFKKDKNQDSIAHYEQLCRDINKKANAAEETFIKEHPSYSISVYLIQKRIAKPFTYTVAELDNWVKIANATTDTARLSTLKQTVESIKVRAKGLPFIDFTVSNEKKEISKMSQYLKPNAYTLIDFWASWCGPCREAIPHVKSFKQKYGNRLNVYSISVDKKEDDWHKAMEKENMPWEQFILPEKFKAEATEGYKFKTIPFLLLIAPDGTIAYATGNTEKLTNVLEQRLGF